MRLPRSRISWPSSVRLTTACRRLTYGFGRWMSLSGPRPIITEPLAIMRSFSQLPSSRMTSRCRTTFMSARSSVMVVSSRCATRRPTPIISRSRAAASTSASPMRPLSSRFARTRQRQHSAATSSGTPAAISCSREIASKSNSRPISPTLAAFSLSRTNIIVSAGENDASSTVDCRAHRCNAIDATPLRRSARACGRPVTTTISPYRSSVSVRRRLRRRRPSGDGVHVDFRDTAAECCTCR